MTTIRYLEVEVAEPPKLDPEDAAEVIKASKRAYNQLEDGRDKNLEKVERYLRNDMDGPYIPSGATDEYRILAERSVSNWIRPALNAPVQCLYIEDHNLSGAADSSPSWEAWQRNRMDARQSEIWRHALSYGSAYVVVDKHERGPHKGRARIRIWGALDTIGLYEDPVNDARPALIFHINQRPDPAGKTAGKATVIDRDRYYDIEWSEDTSKDSKAWRIVKSTEHGYEDTPGVAYVPWRDLSGRPIGLLAPLIPVQDRINQTAFDLLQAQTYTSNVVRTAVGIKPRHKTVNVPITVGMVREDPDLYPVDLDDPRLDQPDETVIGLRAEPVLDADGKPVPEPIVIGASRFLTAEDPNAEFGQLPAANLDYLIHAQQQNITEFASLAQIPPHYLLGRMENLSADALMVAESSLFRMVQEIQHSFGESTEQLMQIIAEIEDLDGKDQFDSEVVWRDMAAKSISQVVDALGKGVTMFGMPYRAAWKRFPGMTGSEYKRWIELDELQKQDGTIDPRNPQSSFGRSISPPNRTWVPRDFTQPTATEPATA